MTRELNKAIKEKKKPSILDTLLPIHNRERKGGRESQPLLLFHQSRYSFFLRMLQVESHFEPRSFQFSFPPSPLPPLSTTRRKNVGIFPLYFLSFPPSPPFFLFISFHLVHRAISEIDFSYPVDVGCTQKYSLYLLEWLYIYYSPINLINIGCSLITASLY